MFRLLFGAALPRVARTAGAHSPVGRAGPKGAEGIPPFLGLYSTAPLRGAVARPWYVAEGSSPAAQGHVMHAMSCQWCSAHCWSCSPRLGALGRQPAHSRPPRAAQRAALWREVLTPPRVLLAGALPLAHPPPCAVCGSQGFLHMVRPDLAQDGACWVHRVWRRHSFRRWFTLGRG